MLTLLGKIKALNLVYLRTQTCKSIEEISFRRRFYWVQVKNKLRKSQWDSKDTEG